MNFLKKLKQPLTGPKGNKQNNNHNNTDKDLEDDLYDEYVVEAPPHPSELLALGVDPNAAGVNLDEKLKELYSKSKTEGNKIACNSVLLAKQRQKEEIEEKKKTREEWKYFDSLTARVQQAVDSTKKTLDHLKESSAIDELTQPEYELKLSADELFKSSATVKQEKEGADNWVDFGEETDEKKKIAAAAEKEGTEDANRNKSEPQEGESKDTQDPFCVPTSSTTLLDILCETSEPISSITREVASSSGPDPFDTSFVKI